jgi:translation initiation factor IF-2
LKKDGKEIGEIKAIQSEGSAVDKASTGDNVAISIDESILLIIYPFFDEVKLTTSVVFL